MFDTVSETLRISGTIGVLPTDTVYGVVARAQDQEAVRRLYELKSREHKPGTLIAADTGQLESLGLQHRYLAAVAHYWPGAVSVVVPCGPELAYLHQGVGSLAVRIPDVPDLRALLSRTGPLLTSSANDPGAPTAQNIDEARQYFGDKVDFYVDGGDLSGRAPSTVLRIIDDTVEVLRQGAVPINAQTGGTIE